MLQTKGPKRWIWDEVKNVSEIDFKFRNIMGHGVDSVVNVTEELGRYEMENVFYGDYDFGDFDEKVLQGVIDQFVVENLRIVLISKDFDKETDKTDPIYETQYSVVPMSDDVKSIFNEPSTGFEWANNLSAKDLDFPEPNLFIPKNFDIVYKGEKMTNTLPINLRNDEKVNFHYWLDNEFLKPKFVMEV